MAESENKNRSYYTVEMMLDEHYMQFPKWLMYDPTFATLSNDAKVLYMILKDRFRLSAKNRWYDKQGRVFVICSRQQMQKLLNKSENTIKKIMNELVDEKIGLIEEKRNKQSNNYIYLLMPKFQNYDDPTLDDDYSDLADTEDEQKTQENKDNSKNLKNCGSSENAEKLDNSRTANFADQQEPQNLRPNKNNSSKDKLVINSLNNNNTLKYISKEDLSVVVNKNILPMDFSIDYSTKAFTHKVNKDFELYQEYKTKTFDIANFMAGYALAAQIDLETYYANINEEGLELYEKGNDLLLKIITNKRFADRWQALLDLPDSEKTEIYKTASRLFSHKTEDRVMYNKSRPSYIIGVIENKISQNKDV